MIAPSNHQMSYEHDCSRGVMDAHEEPYLVSDLLASKLALL